MGKLRPGDGSELPGCHSELVEDEGPELGLGFFAEAQATAQKGGVEARDPGWLGLWSLGNKEDTWK